MITDDLGISNFKFSARDMLRLDAAHARMDFLYENARPLREKGCDDMDKVDEIMDVLYENARSSIKKGRDGMDKVDKIMDVLLDDMDARQLWHVVFNKMTSAAKRQMLNELLNQYFGGYVPVEGSIFESTKDE